MTSPSPIDHKDKSITDPVLQFNPIKAQFASIKHLTITLTQSTSNLSTLTQNLQVLATKYQTYLTVMDQGSIGGSGSEKHQQGQIHHNGTLFQLNTIFFPQYGPVGYTTTPTNPSSLGGLGNNTVDIITMETGELMMESSLEALSEVILSISSTLPVGKDLLNDTLLSLNQFYSNTPLQLLTTYPSYLALVQLSMRIEQELRQFSILFHSIYTLLAQITSNFLKNDKVKFTSSFGEANKTNNLSSKPVTCHTTLDNNKTMIPPTTTIIIGGSPTLQPQPNTAQHFLTFDLFNTSTRDLGACMKNLNNSVDEFMTVFNLINTNS